MEEDCTNYLENSNRSSGIIIVIMQLGASKALKVYNRSNGVKNADTYIPAHSPSHPHPHKNNLAKGIHILEQSSGINYQVDIQL